MPDNNPMADMLSQWKTVSDAFIAQWRKAFEQTAADPHIEEATQEGRRTYLECARRGRRPRGTPVGSH